jgi:hypothetical protein
MSPSASLLTTAVAHPHAQVCIANVPVHRASHARLFDTLGSGRGRRAPRDGRRTAREHRRNRSGPRTPRLRWPMRSRRSRAAAMTCAPR